ncbi:MAG: hypothetical protein GXP30_14805 [Verrucomicrobia bacterium]|nr:hypothetical protein [Verrucomicrobiota bacterium]
MKASPAKFLSARITLWWDRLDSRSALLVLFLLAVLITAVTYLIWGDDPWKRDLPQKFLDGDKLDQKRAITLGLWFGAAFNAVIASLLLASSHWWARQKNHILPPPPLSLPLWSRRLFLWGLIAALTTAAWIRTPRLDHGFWNDEEQTFRKFLWGKNEVTDSGNLKFKAVSWKHTFFANNNGNNQVTNTVQARFFHELWKKFFYQEGDRPFQESIIRFSPFINGLLGIAALALLLRIIGYPLAGVTAAWILTLNPWHLRYSVEARGYADLLLFISLTFIFLTLALRSGKWKWWIAYGLFQSLYLLSFAGAIYLAVAQNLVVLAVIANRRSAVHFWRWLVGTAVGAMLFIQIMIPTAINIIEYMRTHSGSNFPITLAHLQDFWAHLVFGSQWKTQADPSLHHGISIETYQSLHPVINPLMTFVIPFLTLLGLTVILIKGKTLRVFIVALLGSLALIALHNAVAALTFYIWYVIYIVLGFATALAFVPELVADICRYMDKHNTRIYSKYTPLIIAIILIVGYGYMVAPALTRVRTFERHTMRSAVELVRGEAPALDADNGKLLTCAIGSGANQMRTYDPWVKPIKKQGDFINIISKAREQKLPLSVYVCSPLRVQREFPEAWKQLENNKFFEKKENLKSIEEFWSFQIYQLR